MSDLQFLDSLSENNEITEEEVQRTIELINSALKVRALQVIGDLCRNEKNRLQFAKNEAIFTELIKELQVIDEEQKLLIGQFTIRAIGNLAYQNEQNRNKFVELKACNILLEKLKEYESSPTVRSDIPYLRNLGGAFANLTFVCDEEIEKLEKEGILNYFYKIIAESTSSDVLIMFFRALSNLAENDNVKEIIGRIGGENDFIHLITSKFADYLDDASTPLLALLSTLFESHPVNSENFVLAGGLEGLTKFVFEYEEEEEGEVDEDQKEAWKILTTLSSIEKLAGIFWEKNLTQQFVAKLTEKSLNVNISANILLLLGHLAVHQQTMEYLFERSELLVDLLLNGDKPVKIGAAIVIGNIARTDENCVKLGEKEGVVDALLTLLGGDDNPQIQHLCVGALKNIAIPASNKFLLFDKGIIEKVSELISKANNAHVFFNSVLLIKILLGSREEKMADEFSRVGLKVIVELFKKDLLEEQMRIHFEAARLLNNFSSIANYKYRDEVVKEGGIFGLKFLLKSPFPLLQNEGLDFFTKLAAEPQHISEFEDSELLSLLQTLSSSSDPAVNSKSTSLLSSLSSNMAIVAKLKELNEPKEEENVNLPEDQ